MEPRKAVAAAYDEARARGVLVARRRRRNSPVPTIADELEAVTYRGGQGKKGQAFVHEYETAVEAIPIVGGEVELPDGTILEVDPGSVLQRSREGLPLWMEE